MTNQNHKRSWKPYPQLIHALKAKAGVSTKLSLSLSSLLVLMAWKAGLLHGQTVNLIYRARRPRIGGGLGNVA